MRKHSSFFLLFICTMIGCADCSSTGRKSQRKDRLVNIKPTTGDSIVFTEGGRTKPSNDRSQQKNDVKAQSSSDIANVIQQAEPCVFVVYALNSQGKVLGQGTGFFIDASGIGVTNYHVFKPGVQWVIKTFNNQQYKVKRIIKQSDRYDFVVFETEAAPNVAFPFLQIATQTPRKGEEVLILGNPVGLESTLSRGVVSSIRKLDNFDDLIQTDAAISHGSSGSPMMNMSGEVVGIATLKINECENCNFAMNIHLIK